MLEKGRSRCGLFVQPDAELVYSHSAWMRRRVPTPVNRVQPPDGKILAVSLSGEPEAKISLWDVPKRELLRSSLTANDDDFGGGFGFQQRWFTNYLGRHKGSSPKKRSFRRDL